MIDKKLLSIIRCLNCAGSLSHRKIFLICEGCKLKYKVVKDIPILLTKEKTIDVEISKDRWEEFYKKDDLKQYYSSLQAISHYQFLLRFYDYYKKGLYLDLGCGIAYTSLLLAKKGVFVLGIDISKEAVVKSKHLFDGDKVKADFIQADFLDLPLKNNSVDFIYWGLALEYVENTFSAVKESFRVLKKGGRVIAPFPVVSIGNLTYQQLRGDIPRIPILGGLIKWIHVSLLGGEYLRYGYGQSFTVSYIKDVFKKAGYKVEKIEYFDTYYPIAFLPSILRSFFRRLLKYRIFWPFGYIQAVKR